MNRKLLCNVMVWFCLFLLPACSLKNPVDDLPSELHVEQTNDLRDGQINVIDALDIFDDLCEQGNHYEIYTNAEKTGYRYVVMDDKGCTIDVGYHNSRGGFGFSEKDGILELNYGYGTFLWNKRYYDTATGRVSRFFYRPMQTYGETVAYFTTEKDDEITLVIQNMFDPSVYYREFHRNFSVTNCLSDCETVFLNEGRQLKITYWALPNDEKVTEIFDLQSA